MITSDVDALIVSLGRHFRRDRGPQWDEESVTRGFSAVIRDWVAALPEVSDQEIAATWFGYDPVFEMPEPLRLSDVPQKCARIRALFAPRPAR